MTPKFTILHFFFMFIFIKKKHPWLSLTADSDEVQLKMSVCGFGFVDTPALA